MALLNRWLHVAADRAVHAFARTAHLLPAANPARYGVRLLPDLPYRATGDRAHLLDLYVPERAGAGGRPWVFYVHGGGFAMLSKDTHRIMALSFAARGYLVVNINYRLGHRNLYPAPLEDAARALVFARAFVAQHGADPDRFALAGESAGANLVTALTLGCLTPRPEPIAQELFRAQLRPRAVLPIYGLLDVSDIDRLGRRRPLPLHIRAQVTHAAESYVGAPSQSRALGAPLASPLRVLEGLSAEDARGLPPFFFTCGTRDPLLDDSRRLDRALTTLGVPHEFVVHPGEIHGYNAFLWRPAARDMWRRALGFLKRELAPDTLALATRPAKG